MPTGNSCPAIDLGDGSRAIRSPRRGGQGPLVERPEEAEIAFECGRTVGDQAEHVRYDTKLFLDGGEPRPGSLRLSSIVAGVGMRDIVVSFRVRGAAPDVKEPTYFHCEATDCIFEIIPLENWKPWWTVLQSMSIFLAAAKSGSLSAAGRRLRHSARNGQPEDLGAKRISGPGCFTVKPPTHADRCGPVLSRRL